MSGRSSIGLSGFATVVSLAAAALMMACGDEARGDPAVRTGGVVVHTEPDLERFRAIVDDGDVPAAQVLDPDGFFAAHTLALPERECAENLCVHASLAVASRLNGENWTTAFIAVSAADAVVSDRPPRHLAILVEESLITLRVTTAIARGVRALLGELGPDDRVTLLPYRASLQPGVVSVPPDSAELIAAVPWLAARAFNEDVAPHDALAAAQSVLSDTPAGMTRHIVLVTSGAANTGVTSLDRLRALAAGIARAGTSLSVIGVGDVNHYDPRLSDTIRPLRAGRCVRALDETELIEALQREGMSTTRPIATALAVRVVAAPGYRIERIEGDGASFDSSEATLSAPAVFARAPEFVDARVLRGWFVELSSDASVGAVAGAPALEVDARWWSLGGTPRRVTITTSNTLPPGVIPPDGRPRFGTSGRGKPYVMLQFLRVLRTAADLHADGRCASALGLIDEVTPGIARWQTDDPDADITADSLLLQQLRANVAELCGGRSPSRAPASFAGFAL